MGRAKTEGGVSHPVVHGRLQESNHVSFCSAPCLSFGATAGLTATVEWFWNCACCAHLVPSAPQTNTLLLGVPVLSQQPFHSMRSPLLFLPPQDEHVGPRGTGCKNTKIIVGNLVCDQNPHVRRRFSFLILLSKNMLALDKTLIVPLLRNTCTRQENSITAQMLYYSARCRFYSHPMSQRMPMPCNTPSPRHLESCKMHV